MMTSRRGSSGDRPRHPGMKARLGEDPARFLAVSTRFAMARIRGLETIELCNAWAAVERKHFGGRRRILDAIEQRKRELEGSR